MKTSAGHVTGTRLGPELHQGPLEVSAVLRELVGLAEGLGSAPGTMHTAERIEEIRSLYIYFSFAKQGH